VEGLLALHDAAVVHRDLKPANVLLSGTEGALVAKISDFGISRFGPPTLGGPIDPRAATVAASPTPEASHLTSTGAMLGTPLYMAPEAAKGGRTVEASADVFAFGILAYEAITGYRPSDPSTDRGAVELDVLRYWRKTGIGGTKIEAFIALEPKNHLHVQAAVELFGGSYIGLALPVSAQQQAVWSVPPGGPTGTGAPGSWGGHAVVIEAYDAHGLTCITWGQKKKMTWSFWDAYCDEAYALLSELWAGKKATAPSGFDLAALKADLKAVTG